MTVIGEPTEGEQSYDVECVCSNCADVALVRFLAGEPIDQNDLICHCGGELSEVLT